MPRRNQIDIAIDALKKQLHKYKEEYEKADESMKSAQKTKEFFHAEIDRLGKQIQSLEGTNAG